MKQTDKIVIYVIIITSELLQVPHHQLTHSIVEHSATSSKLVHLPSFNLHQTTNVTILTRNIFSRTHTSQTSSQLSKKSDTHKTLMHSLQSTYPLSLLISPICRFRSLNTSYSLLNSPQAVHSYHNGTSFRLTQTVSLLYTLPTLQKARTTVYSSQNIQTTSIRAKHSSSGGRNVTIIHDSRTRTTSFMVDAFSSDPTKILTSPDIFNVKMNCH